MLVLGGRERLDRPSGSSGPPPDDREFARSVAAYDPAADRWRRLAPTPFAPTDVSAAVVGRTVYVLTGLYHGKARLYGYDLDADAWRALARPPRGGDPNRVSAIVAAGTKVLAWFPYVQDGTPVDLLYDPATDGWTRAPRNPIGGTVERTVVGLADGRVISVGVPRARDRKPHYDGPRFFEATAFDPVAGTWELPPKAPFVQGGAEPQWPAAAWSTCPRSATTGTATRSPLTYAVGGELDLETETWSALPARPEGADVLAGPSWATGSGGDLALLEGWALDVPEGEWTQVPNPPGPAVGLTSPAVAFAGRRLLVWGGATRDAGCRT